MLNMLLVYEPSRHLFITLPFLLLSISMLLLVGKNSIIVEYHFSIVTIGLLHYWWTFKSHCIHTNTADLLEWASIVGLIDNHEICSALSCHLVDCCWLFSFTTVPADILIFLGILYELINFRRNYFKFKNLF